MLNGKSISVVMPAYNAERTVEKTFAELPAGLVDDVILTDDFSSDATAEVSEKLGITTLRHDHNRGYGANQKTCYRAALERGADIVVMVHPDYQYTPLLITAMTSMIAYDVYDVVIASRILGKTARAGGMPLYKYISNRALTLVQNIFLGQKLSEYHTGYRAYSREVLESLPLEENSDDFVFDNEMLTQIAYFNFRVGEVSCPTKYFEEASTIGIQRSVKYGFGCLANCLLFSLARGGLYTHRLFRGKPKAESSSLG